jgi:transposase
MKVSPNTIGTQSLDGNSADVSNYIPAWKKIKEEIGTTNFLTIGDCKLSSDENLLTIMKGKGYFVSPLAMYSTLKKDLIKYVVIEKKPLELLKQTKQNENLTISYSGFEVDAKIVDKETGKEYPYRQIFVYSSQLNQLKLKSINDRIAKSIEEIDDFKEKIKYGKKYDCVEKVSEKISSILKKHNCEELINFTVNEETIVTKKKIGRGRSSSTSEYTYTEKKNYQ